MVPLKPETPLIITSLDLALGGDGTLQERLYRQVRDGILSGRLPPGLKLPSTRDLAQQLSVARNTVTLAFEWLASEGYLTTRKGAGTFVADLLPEAALEAPRAPGAPLNSGVEGPRRTPPIIVTSGMPAAVGRERTRSSIDFWYGRLDRREFPATTWRRLLLENLSRAGPNLVEYGHPAGHPELRAAIASHLAATRGIPASPDRIVITAGAQDGFNVIARMLIAPGTSVLVEDPCYGAAASVFDSYGASLIPVPVDADGLTTDSLAGRAGALVYVTPSHQFPTGATMPLARRRELLRWASAAGAYVVEDDYDSDFRYDGPPLTALAGVDRDRRVIYVGSFSKSIGAGLRLGYLVLPPELVEPALVVKSLGSYGQPWIDQIVVAEFLRSGGHRQHLRRLRQMYKTRRDALLGSLRSVVGEQLQVSGHEAGMHLFWTLPEWAPDPATLAARARELDVGIYTPQAVGVRTFGPPGEVDRALMLGYSALSAPEIVTGIQRVGQLLRSPSSNG